MANKIFNSILIAAMTILVSSLLVVTWYMYRYFGEAQEDQLHNELELASYATERLGEDYLEQVRQNPCRLTWVAADGTVLYDTQEDAKTMGNHADREEIKEALRTGRGSSSRYSETRTEETLYEASRLSDGTVLRISVRRLTALALVLRMMQPVAVVAFLALLLSAFLARRMADYVVRPLNQIDLEHPLENQTYEELSPLLHQIHTQHIQICSQMRILKQKTDEFDQITVHMKEGLILLDGKGRILSINPAAQFLFQRDQSFIGEDFLTVDRSHDMNVAVQNAMETGHSKIRAMRNEREYQFDLSRIDSEGTVAGVVLLAFDVTEQADAERGRREFTANVSHELKTPLQSIIGSAELMENGIVRQEDMPRFVERIRKEASHLVSLVDDVIRLSQLDEGGEMAKEEISLYSLAEDAAVSLQGTADAKKVRLSVEGSEGRMRGVPGLIYQVVYNLCENAVKYNTEGGSVWVSVEEDEREVALTVRDTGIGIAPEHQGRIFERFYRVDKSHSRQSGGTGLGLSIVKHAVQFHHGEIHLQSALGAGTTVKVTWQKTGNA